MVIQIDSREKGNGRIIDYFDEVGQKYIVSKMYAGDYQNVNSVEVLIDRKDSMLEISNNLCRTTEHQRIKREIKRACDIDCKRFIFLIADNDITCVEEVHSWIVPKKKNGQPFTRVNLETLEKIMKTMEEKYGVEFEFCKKEEMGKRIIEILKGEDK